MNDEHNPLFKRNYFRVVHKQGCMVRTAPKLDASTTGLVVCQDSIVPTKHIVHDDGNTFVELIEGGWLVAAKGSNLQACVPVDGPVEACMKLMTWIENPQCSYYKVTHRSGCVVRTEPSVTAQSTGRVACIKRYKDQHPLLINPITNTRFISITNTSVPHICSHDDASCCCLHDSTVSYPHIPS